jgi:hypothetical protein
MSCCGNKRRPWYEKQTSSPAAQPARSGPVAARRVALEYVGGTALTAVGSITRARYRFEAPGAVLQIDARDAPAMLAVPHLRRVRASLSEA